MKHKKYLPVMATVSAVILLAGCRGIKDTGDKESIMEKSRLFSPFWAITERAFFLPSSGCCWAVAAADISLWLSV